FMSLPVNVPVLPAPQLIAATRDAFLAQASQSRYEPGNRVLFPRVASPNNVLPIIELNNESTSTGYLWINEAGRIWKADNNPGFNKLYHSDDNGDTWVEISNEIFEDRPIFPLRDLPNGEVLIGLSSATDPPEFWVSNGYQSNSPTWTKVLTVDSNF